MPNTQRPTPNAHVCAWVLVALLVAPAPLMAQSHEPPGPYVVDARAVFPRFRQNNLVAGELLVPPTNLPSGGFGLSLGAHWYPIHSKLVTLGIGGEWLAARGSQTVEAVDEAAPSPTVRDRFSVISPQVSINFGGRNGWSYISGGIGRAKLTMELADEPLPPAPWRRAINYGVGARWYTSVHVAVSLDLRWYAVDQEPVTLGRPLIPRMTLLMLSGGVALR